MKKINVDLNEIALAHNNFYAINSKMDEFGIVSSMNGLYNNLAGSTPNFAERFKFIGNSAKAIQEICENACKFIKNVIELYTENDIVDIFTATGKATSITGDLYDMLALIANTLRASKFVNSKYYGDLGLAGEVLDGASLILSAITFGIKGGSILADIWDPNKSTLTKVCDGLATGVSILGAVVLVGLGSYFGGPVGGAIGAFVADAAMSKESIQALSGSFEAILTADIKFAVDSASKCVGNAVEVASKSVNDAYDKMVNAEGGIPQLIACGELLLEGTKAVISIATTAVNSAIGVVGSAITTAGKAVVNWFSKW